jgi:DNA polymerase III sliding clamp (beta) subunit (PCNA family)
MCGLFYFNTERTNTMNPITIPMTELRPALAGLGKIITRRPTLPVLGCIRVERTKTNRIELTGTDLDTTAVVQLDAPAQGEPTAFLIPYEDLNNVAKSCGKEDSLLLTQVEENRVAIRFPVGGQMIEHRCKSIPVDEFPDIVEVRGEPIPLDGKLRNAIHDALGCASTDPTQAILNGAHLDVSKPQGHYVVATDGHHLFSSNSFKLPLKDSITIPSHRFLGWKEFNNDGDWTLRAAKSESNQPLRFEIATRHWRIIARSLEGKYPQWRAVVPDPGNVKTTVEIEFGAEEEDVIRAIARMPDHDPKHHAIGLEIAGNKFSLLGKSPGSDKWIRVELSTIKAIGHDVTIHLNRQFLTKALRLGLTRIEITDPITPLRFSNGGRQMIVMPVRPAPASSIHTSRTQSAPVATITTAPRHAEQPERKPMTENSSTNGATRSTTIATPMETAERPALETALAQIDVIRGEFRSAVAGLSKLGDLLKQASREQKVSDKEIQGVRQTLRSLQSVRI